MKTSGFSLLELLVSISIVGVLAAVLTPNLISARNTAQYRAEITYAGNVYKVANAYLAANVDQTQLPSSSCLASFDAAGFSAGDAPNSLTSCTVSINAAGLASVTYAGLNASTTIGSP